MSLVLLDTHIVLRLLDRAAPEHNLCVDAIENLLCRGDTPNISRPALVFTKGDNNASNKTNHRNQKTSNAY